MKAVEQSQGEGVRNRSRRARAVVFLRDVHGWLGLWGAVLGLLFGFSGIWLNHRAVLKLPPVAQQRSNASLELPNPPPADADALAAWLQTALKLDKPASNIRTEKSKPVAWAEKGDRSLMQPEQWTVNFATPQTLIQVEGWAGARVVHIRRTDNGVIATLMNLHKGVGLSVGWILLVDTLAGSLIMLSLSGIALWVLTHKRRTVGWVILGASVTTAFAMVSA